MNTMNLQDIRRDSLGFVGLIEAGESILVVHGENALAEVRPVGAVVDGQRPFGLCAGQFSVPNDFDQPLPVQVVEEFEGS